MKRNRHEFPIVLQAYLDEKDAWGTEFGAWVFGRINLELLNQSDGTLVPIDYSGLTRSDVSFQREAVVETLRKHRPKLLFIARGLTDPDIRENLALALEKRGEALLVADDPFHPTVLGKRLSAEQFTTLEKAWSEGRVASTTFADLNLSTASSRLTTLWRAGLLERVEGTSPSGGREHRYYSIRVSG
ncbi:MAG: hypothetical protein WKF55_10820 [Gemmatimonadaceae bacterium]